MRFIRGALIATLIKITIESNLTETDFLYVELDLINDSYAPFRKPIFQASMSA